MSASVADLEIGVYRRGEEQAILDCVRSCFAFEPRIERWRQLYRDNPCGEAVIVVARHGSRIVSHDAVLPCRMRAFGEELMAAHFVDSMTLPEWRRRGVKTRISLEVKKICRERNWVLSFSFNNEESYHGVLKYEGRHNIAMPRVMVRPVRAVRAGLVMTRRRFGFRARGQPEPRIPDCGLAGPIPDHSEQSSIPSWPAGWSTPAFDERHTDLFRSAGDLPPIARVRDATRLEWRYLAPPRSPYLQKDVTAAGSLKSSVIVRRATLDEIPIVFVMEWLWTEGAEGEGCDLIKEALHLARVVDAHGVAVLAQRGTRQYHLLQRCGFMSVPRFLINKSVYFLVGWEEQEEDRARWMEPSNWYLTWGDGLIL